MSSLSRMWFKQKDEGWVEYINTFGKTEDLTDGEPPPRGKGEHWGAHLMLDASGANKNLDDEKQIKKFIKELVKKIDMKVGAPLLIKHFKGEGGSGWSAVQLITTSTITFHGDDSQMRLFLDVFSCKNFDPKLVKPLVKKYFNPKHIKEKFLYRDAGSKTDS